MIKINKKLKRYLKKFAKKVKSKSNIMLNIKRNIYDHYENILGHESGHGITITDSNVLAGSITWVIPDFEIGSGGHINIFRMIKLLKARGFNNQHVVIMEPHKWQTAEEAGAIINAAFDEPGISVSLGIETLMPSEYIFATSWQTAYWVSKYRDALYRCYFVQDFEPLFYPAGDEYYLAENTYKLGLHGVTAGKWLGEKLKNDYGMNTFHYTFSYDKHLYNNIEKRAHEKKNIFFYARPVTPRRCFHIGLMALAKVCEEIPDAAVILAGWDVSDFHIPFNHVNSGSLPIEQLPDLYAQCDAALVLSGTNLSLLPMEIAATGCPMILNDAPCANWIFDESEVRYSQMDPTALAQAIVDVLSDPDGAAEMAARARQKALASDWGKEADGVAEFLRSLRGS